jgi:hypothetical protein
MKNKIGEIAGKVWKTLGEREHVNLLRLPTILQEKEEIVYQALGRLAREDKVNYLSKEGKTSVSLRYAEREIFRNSLKTSLKTGSQENLLK